MAFSHSVLVPAPGSVLSPRLMFDCVSRMHSAGSKGITRSYTVYTPRSMIISAFFIDLMRSSPSEKGNAIYRKGMKPEIGMR